MSEQQITPPGGNAPEPDTPPRAGGSQRRILAALLGVLAVYLVVAYVAIPLGWHSYEKKNRLVEGIPDITYTGAGIPGDPLNIAFAGSEEQLFRIMQRAKWYPADPITLRSSLRIAVDVVFDRPFNEAPVSNLFLFGRKEDLAFEQPIGKDPKKRNHVRFWKAPKPHDGRILWVGAGTQDERVGLSHTTGQVTHHIGADIDSERDHILDTWQKSGLLQKVSWIDDFHTQREGKNGGGDPWRTDGRLAIGISDTGTTGTDSTPAAMPDAQSTSPRPRGASAIAPPAPPPPARTTPTGNIPEG
jgi:hypothetical protein